MKMYGALLCVMLLCAVACVDQEPGEAMAEGVTALPSSEEGGLLSSSLEASLKERKSDTAELAPGVFISGVPTSTFLLRSDPDMDGRQRQSQWCWAATIQMVVNFHGVDLEQEDIVLRAYGYLRDRPATQAEITSVIHDWQLIDRHGDSWQLKVDASDRVDAVAFIEDLHFNQPLIAGLQNVADDPSKGGHAFVMSSISYRLDARGLIYPFEVSLRDPWPDNPSQSTISWQEFLSRYMFHVRVRALPIN